MNEIEKREHLAWAYYHNFMYDSEN